MAFSANKYGKDDHVKDFDIGNEFLTDEQNEIKKEPKNSKNDEFLQKNQQVSIII
jgi:hypothetical protein